MKGISIGGIPVLTTWAELLWKRIVLIYERQDGNGERNEEKADWYWWKGTCCFSLVSAHKSVSFLVIPPPIASGEEAPRRENNTKKSQSAGAG